MSVQLNHLTAQRTLLWRVGWLLLATLAVHAVALVATGGDINGPVSLRKPMTFAEATWLLCWSVSLALRWVRLRPKPAWFVTGAVILFGVGETTIMAIQAWRGVPSHYNFTTTFDAVLMRGGAAGLAVVLLAGLVVLLVGVRRSDAPPAVRLGLTAGTLLLLVGCVIGFAMISNMSGVFQGSFGGGFSRPQVGYAGPPASDVGHEVFAFRPHTAGGDLVLLHAIGVHGLVLLGMPAMLLADLSMSERERLLRVRLLVGSVVVGLVVLAAHALRQQPWDSLAPWEYTVAAAARPRLPRNPGRGRRPGPATTPAQPCSRRLSSRIGSTTHTTAKNAAIRPPATRPVAVPITKPKIEHHHRHQREPERGEPHLGERVADRDEDVLLDAGRTGTGGR